MLSLQVKITDFRAKAHIDVSIMMRSFFQAMLWFVEASFRDILTT